MTQTTSRADVRRLPLRLILLMLVASLGGVLYFVFRDQLSLAYLAEHESWLREFKESNLILVILLAAGIYVVVTGFSFPGAAIFSVAYGWYFGFLPALAIVSICSTAGATIAFLLSRYFFRVPLQKKFGERLQSFNQNLERDGPFYLFTLRLIPAVPFFLINILMGLTPIRATTFWWISQIGMLPGTIIFVFFGSTFPDLATLQQQGLAGVLRWELGLAFVLLGLTPLVLKKFIERIRPRQSSQEHNRPEHE